MNKVFLFPIPAILILLPSFGDHQLLAEETAVPDAPSAPLNREGVILRHQAHSWEDLVRDLRPTLTWNRCDMLWVAVDASGKPSLFDLDRAYRIREWGVWATLDDDGSLSGRLALASHYTGVRAPILGTLERSDAGPRNQALVLAEDPGSGTLYRLYWNERLSTGSGNYLEGRWVLALRGRGGSWQLIGELPGASRGKVGGGHSVRCDIEMRASWTGDPEAPVRIDFTRGSYDVESGPDQIGLPTLATYRDGVLEGTPPANPRWTTSEYLVAKPGDSLEAVVHRLSVWSVGYSFDRPERRERIRAIHHRSLKELNPGLPEDAIPEGTRIKILSHGEFSKALTEADRADAAPAPESKAGTDRGEARKDKSP